MFHSRHIHQATIAIHRHRWPWALLQTFYKRCFSSFVFLCRIYFLLLFPNLSDIGLLNFSAIVVFRSLFSYFLHVSVCTLTHFVPDSFVLCLRIKEQGNSFLCITIFFPHFLIKHFKFGFFQCQHHSLPTHSCRCQSASQSSVEHVSAYCELFIYSRTFECIQNRQRLSIFCESILKSN